MERQGGAVRAAEARAAGGKQMIPSIVRTSVDQYPESERLIPVNLSR